MQSETLLLVSVICSLMTSTLLWAWLKSALRDLLGQLCHSGGNTEFWVRYTLLMLIIAPLAIVIWFTPDYTQSLVQSARHLLLSILLSHFFAFSLVGRTLYRAVQQIQKEQAPLALTQG